MSQIQQKGKDPLAGMTSDATLALLVDDAMKKEGGGPLGGLPPSLLKLIELEYQEKLEARQEKESELRRLKESQVEAAKVQMENIRYTQEVACDHRKENGRPRIGGQRLSNGHTCFICQFCQKTWTDNLPAHPQIDLAHIGG